MPREIIKYWQVTKYIRSCNNGDIISVEFRGHGKWAVMMGGNCLGRNGEWNYEPMPSGRDEDWLEMYRFDDFDAAFSAAEEAVEFA